MMKNYRFIVGMLCVLAFLEVNTVAAQNAQSYFKNFPIGADPAFVGKKMSERLMETKHQLYGDRGIHYAEVCTWYGALRFAEATKDQGLINKLRNRFELLFHIEKELLPPPIHVDQNMFGCLPLKLYRLTKDERYKELGLPYADTQWVLPQNANETEKKWHKKGYSWQTRLWIDDMYMITIVQAEAYHVTGDKKYINRAAEEMVLYLDEIQRENGLFYHAPDVPFYWGRGDGWMAVGMTELLLNLPESDTNYQRIYKGYRLMMESLKKYVNQDGVWNQLIDVKDCWTETSGSAMFTYAMIIGVKNGWLDADEYGPIIRRAWMSLCNFIDDKNDVTEVCIGTGKKNSYQYYLDRPRIAGDYHGQAPMIWCATALLED
ncbi:MAG TPA: glycoside hydrolase family 88 protein [Candidatus Bacteroides merdavium]|uniref:Glycoside hydrolase family 88 protein n=1 Tax=Candidatus Bacteroides merdavium TaxID=2838472 RepID=A0A9D2KCT8_9BACE|nr:glycoside hydrolase family 88 protein [Candidatus Bacteroides merdavium]